MGALFVMGQPRTAFQSMVQQLAAGDGRRKYKI
jgi:hypothetical protein